MIRLIFLRRDILFNPLTVPLLLSTIVLGLVILIVFVSFDLLATMQGLVSAHLAMTFVIRATHLLAASFST